MTSFFLPLANSPVATVSPAAEIYLSLAAVGRGEETFSLPPAELSHFFLPFPPEGEKGGEGEPRRFAGGVGDEGDGDRLSSSSSSSSHLSLSPKGASPYPPAFSSFNAKVKLEDGKTLARLQKSVSFSILRNSWCFHSTHTRSYWNHQRVICQAATSNRRLGTLVCQGGGGGWTASSRR